MSFLIQDDFESYASTADVQTAYGAANVTGGLATTGGREGTKGFQGTIKSTAVSGSLQSVVVGMAYLGGSAARMQFWGPDAHTPIPNTILLCEVGTDAIGSVYYNLGTGNARVSTPMRAENAWRYLEVQYLTDVALGHLHIAIDGVRLFDAYGATSPNTALSYVIFEGLFDEIYARDPRSPDYLANPVDYIDPATNAADFVGDYRLRNTAALDPATATGTARVTQQYGIAAYRPPLPTVGVTQQFLNVAYLPPKPKARVTQQYVIVAIKNKPGSRVRPQVFGVGR